MAQGTLFPLSIRPTMRDVALAVREGGEEGLPGGVRRADEATYQEVKCRSALNHVEGMPFAWTLNPYRGCTHGCHYCFARRYHRQFELNAGDQFASIILVKTNFVGVLARELSRPAWTRELVALGTATDPYQPIEGRYKLTRGAIVELAAAKTPVSIVTKGPMVVRDADVLLEATKAARCTVCISVPSVDEDAWRRLEPGTAHPLQRLRAVRTLTQAGVRAGVLMAPIVPGITTSKRGARGDDLRHRRARRRVRRRKRPAPRGRNARPLLRASSAANTRTWSTATSVCTRMAPSACLASTQERSARRWRSCARRSG